MEIVRIFVDVDGIEGLHAIRMHKDLNNEYDRTFDLWYDPEYLLVYCKRYERDIFGFFGINKLEDFVELIYQEVEQLEDGFLDFADQSFRD